MSNKAATGGVDDFTFIMTCVSSSDSGFPKPDFEAVAAKIGAKNANSCYHRLWNIKKVWGMTGTRKGNGAGAAAAAAAQKASKGAGGKRGGGKKAAEADVDNEDSGEEEVETPSKKQKIGKEKKGVFPIKEGEGVSGGEYGIVKAEDGSGGYGGSKEGADGAEAGKNVY